MATNDYPLYASDLFGNRISSKAPGSLGEEFVAPPFTVLNAQHGWWIARKRQWLSLGIKSEEGRDADLLGMSIAAQGRCKNVSVFDPVLCELCYRWFCPPGGQVIDPFAGGSVRGIVATLLGRRYWGCDLRREQVQANRRQAKKITPGHPPTWIVGDASDLLPEAPKADFVFTCPPYGHLERYSDNPKDLSNMPYNRFINTIERIIDLACDRLRTNRFACFVVGNFRDKRGHYNDFVSATIEAFRKKDLPFYNEGILITSAGTLPMRARAAFSISRKLGKGHQNVLLFLKGDARKAAQAIGAMQK